MTNPASMMFSAFFFGQLILHTCYTLDPKLNILHQILVPENSVLNSKP